MIPVVGQDLLVTRREDGSEVLLYRLLAEHLAERLKVSAEDLPVGCELNEVACRYRKKTSDLGPVYRHLTEAWEAIRGNLEPPAPLTNLAEIEPLKLFVSTTFVESLETALDKKRHGGKPRTLTLTFSPSAHTDLTDPKRVRDHATVFHLFGQVSWTQRFAVTEADILNFVYYLFDDTKRPTVLLEELGRCQLLILGCSFPDWLTRFFIRVTQGKSPAERWSKSLLADAGLQAQPQDQEGAVSQRIDDEVRPSVDTRGRERLKKFLSSFWSDRIYIFEGGDAVDFVNELHSHWSARKAPAGGDGEPRRIRPNFVFLSYAHEDREVVERIRDELDKQMDVWFDKKKLRGGDKFEPEIKQNIRECSLFIPIISRSVLDRSKRFFRHEWKYAEYVAEFYPPDRTFIVPVVIDGTDHKAKGLPEKFKDLHWLDLTDGRPSPEFVAEVKQLFRDSQT